MKLLSILGLSAALVAGLGAAAAAGDKDAKAAKVGEKAPTWVAKDIKGKEWKSADFAGKIVVLDWVNPDCPVCKGAHKDGRIAAMIKELKSLDAVFIGVNSTHYMDAAKNEQALKDYGIEYPVLLDNEGTIGRAYGARTTPHLFVIDTTGVLRYQGAIDEGNPGQAGKINYAVNAVKQIKAGETVSPENTKSYGCNVKYKSGDKPKDKASN
jgi:peroxiredoxin